MNSELPRGYFPGKFIQLVLYFCYLLSWWGDNSSIYSRILDPVKQEGSGFGFSTARGASRRRTALQARGAASPP